MLALAIVPARNVRQIRCVSYFFALLVFDLCLRLRPPERIACDQHLVHYDRQLARVGDTGLSVTGAVLDPSCAVAHWMRGLDVENEVTRSIIEERAGHAVANL